MPLILNHMHVAPTFESDFQRKLVLAHFMVTPETDMAMVFDSPEAILNLMTELMENASKVWPEHEIIKEYLSIDKS